MPTYNHTSGIFSNRNGIEIFHQQWTVEAPEGTVIIIHGLGEHSGRYGHLIQAMAGKNISFFALDHQGHGRSGGKRGHVNDFSDYVEDIRRFIDTIVKKNAPDRPLVCLGHSMGGLIATCFALSYQTDIAALVLSSPAFIPGVRVPAIQAAAAKMAARILPRLTQSNKLSADDLSHDPETVQAYRNDPLVHDRVSTRWFVSFLATAEDCLNRAGELSLPLLVIHGGTDNIVSPEGSRQVYDRTGSADKTLRVFERLKHETMNEPPDQRAPVLKLLSDWIVDHLG